MKISREQFVKEMEHDIGGVIPDGTMCIACNNSRVRLSTLLDQYREGVVEETVKDKEVDNKMFALAYGELLNIVKANVADDFQDGDEFVRWAKNRANFTMKKIDDLREEVEAWKKQMGEK